jgi:diguanylate cyclase (GGDEF)-like protein/PAS domain S-box-containing protein
MGTGWSGFAATLFLNALLTTALAVSALRQPRVPGHRAFAAAMFALALWALGYGMEAIEPLLETKAAWLRFENVGIVFLLPFFLVFALEYAGWSGRAAWRLLPLLAIVPSISLLLVFSGSPLYYPGVRVFSEAGGPLVVARGPWYHAQLVHSYLLMLAGTGLILRAVARLPSLFRAQAALLLAGILLPWGVNVLYHARALWGEPGVDLTPLAFGGLGLVYGLGLFRLHLFDLLPVARDSVLEGMPEMVLVFDEAGRLADANRAAAAFLGAPAPALRGRPAAEVLAPWPSLAPEIAGPLEAPRCVEVTADPPRWLELSAAPLRDRVGRPAGRVVVARDVTERVLSERALADMDRRRQEASEQVRLLSAAMGAAASAVAVSDAKGTCLWVNPAFTQITGYAADEIVGRSLSLLKSGVHDAAFYRGLWRTILAGDVWRGEIVNRHRSGRLYTEEMTIAPVRDASGALAHFVAVKQDVTDRKHIEAELREANTTLRSQLAEIEALQERLQEQATRDPLTGLYNRRFFAETLVRETARARRGQQPYALVIFDADHFKTVNDTHGHEAGDCVLIALGRLLRAQTREGDLVCRFGGEEFVVLLPGADAGAALARADAWRAALESRPLLEERPTLLVTMSGGVASFPHDGPDGESVLRAADRALYEAKASGRNCVRQAGAA